MNLMVGIENLFNQGGIMMYPLALSSVILWFALGVRIFELNFFTKKEPMAIKKYKTANSHHLKNDEREAMKLRCELDLQKFDQLIFTIIALAPLLGLLGTVMGMIETFASLGDGQLYGATGGIAGGISSALLTTQMGLAVAIPGLLLARPLKKKETDYKEILMQL